ncbi:MAG: sigma 54-interacting transcriptional regulator [Rubrivivax sp.]|nr:sigma 54-interacting transcriptional regulator [Rubrivivax sp.]
MVPVDGPRPDRTDAREAPARRCPFVKVNCAAIPESPFERERFGYESASLFFTGAHAARPLVLRRTARRGVNGLVRQHGGNLPTATACA